MPLALPHPLGLPLARLCLMWASHMLAALYPNDCLYPSQSNVLRYWQFALHCRNERLIRLDNPASVWYICRLTLVAYPDRQENNVHKHTACHTQPPHGTWLQYGLGEHVPPHLTTIPWYALFPRHLWQHLGHLRWRDFYKSLDFWCLEKFELSLEIIPALLRGSCARLRNCQTVLQANPHLPLTQK